MMMMMMLYDDDGMMMMMMTMMMMMEMLSSRTLDQLSQLITMVNYDFRQSATEW